MPSAKPDPNEANALRIKRGIRYSEPSAQAYVELHTHCEAAVSDGYITSERAITLLKYLQTNPSVARIYPNNVLNRLLLESCESGGWSSDFEHDLLHLIYSLYLGYESNATNVDTTITITFDEEGSSTSISEQTPHSPRPPADLTFELTQSKLRSAKWRDALLRDHLDTVTGNVALQNKLVGFTGKFAFGTRAECFSEARNHGAVPCDPAPYMDYLFVSREFENYGAASSKIASAIYFRRLYGTPFILSEHVWVSSINELNGQG
jgi:hypothetical protein